MFAAWGRWIFAHRRAVAACNAGFVLQPDLHPFDEGRVAVWGNCDGSAASGCEVDLRSSASNCGACGDRCASGVCTAGVCASGARTYSGSCVTGFAPPPSACTRWDTWRAGLGTTYTRVTIRGTFNAAGVSCTNPAVVNGLATALRTGANFSMSCDGRAWSLRGTRYNGERGIDPPAACSSSNCPSGYIVRPCQGSNWGGVNTATCNAPSQTMAVDFL